MKRLFQNKYRVDSTRLRTWDYSSAGMYFVTICTKYRKPYFGEIIVADLEFTDDPIEEGAHMRLSELGKIAEIEWLKTPQLRPDMNLELGDFVVMPDHFHALIGIGENRFNGHDPDGIAGENGGRGAMHGASTNQFGPQSKNLASIIRGYKSAVTTYARKNAMPFDWQARFHDHIVRSADEYYRIANYIRNNIRNNRAKWRASSWWSS